MVDISPYRSGDAPYVVVRLDQDVDTPAGHDHVAAIETRDPDGGSTRWTAVDVISAIRDGERFVMERSDARDVELEPALCSECPRATVKASAGDSLPAG